MQDYAAAVARLLSKAAARYPVGSERKRQQRTRLQAALRNHGPNAKA
jgi:hypothetical protein